MTDDRALDRWDHSLDGLDVQAFNEALAAAFEREEAWKFLHGAAPMPPYELSPAETYVADWAVAHGASAFLEADYIALDLPALGDGANADGPV